MICLKPSGGLRRGIIASVLVTLLAMSYSLAYSQDSPDAPALRPLSEKTVSRLDAMINEIESEFATTELLEKRLATAEGLAWSITMERLDRTWTGLFHSAISLAEAVIAEKKDGKDTSKYYNRIVEHLTNLPDIAFIALDHIVGQISYTVDEQSTVEQVRADQELFAAIDAVDRIYSVLLAHVRIAPEFSLNVDQVRVDLVEQLVNAAENRSIFLDMSSSKISSLRASTTILPDNEELKGELSVVDARVRLAADALQNAIGMLSELGMDVQSYRKQILTTTGSITTDVLDVGIAANLAKEWSATVSSAVAQKGPVIVFRFLIVVLVLYLFTKLSQLVRNLVGRGLDSAHVQLSRLLRRMMISTTGNLVLFLGFLIALSQLGISLGPLLAGLGIAGFIIGFAMQDSLANFASGMLILLYRPFDVGDVVDAGGVQGKVSSMSLVNTTIMTLDNQTLIVPNNLIWGSVIKNVTAQRTRRIDFVFGISYGDDIIKAEKVFRNIVESHPKTLDDPEAMVHVHELGDSSVNFIVRPWVNTIDYWEVYWDITREVKLRLDKEGISIPFPQRDVHMYQQKPA